MFEKETRTRFDDPSNGLQVIDRYNSYKSYDDFLCKNDDDNFCILRVLNSYRLSEGCFIEDGKDSRKYSSKVSPNILVIGDVDKGYRVHPKEEHFLIADYVPGISLHDFLEIVRGPDEKPNEINVLIKYKIIFGIAQGLNLVHKRGGVNGILMPTTILLDQDLNPHFCFSDLTWSRFMNFFERRFQPPGSEFYPDQQSDVHRFGSTLFQIITYEWPFSDVKYQKLMSNPFESGVMDNRIESGVITINKKDEPLYEIVKMCWNQDPKERPTMDEISHWIYDAAPNILGDAFDEFNEYACSIDDNNYIAGTSENVRKAIAHGFTKYDHGLRKIASLENIPIGDINEYVERFSEFKNRPPTKSKRNYDD